MTSLRSRGAGGRVPTMTSLVRDALARADDFLTSDQIARMAALRPQDACKTLAWLRQVHVVDRMESGGRLWWFLTGADDRVRAMEERAKEAQGNRGGRVRAPRAPVPDLPSGSLLSCEKAVDADIKSL
jgi:hypothetical protein